MLDAEMIQDGAGLWYADAEHLADLWNRAYPTMREIATNNINGLRLSIERKSWEVDPRHPQAEALKSFLPKEERVRRKLKLAEDLRRTLGQVDRGTHKLCTRSPGGFSVTGAYMVVRNLIGISSLSTKGLGDVYRLAAVLADAEEVIIAERAAWHKERMEAHGTVE
jgi:hypothetical protein